MILPFTNVQASDVKDTSYYPINEYDQSNYEIYDPGLFQNAPVGLQLIGRSMQEEHLFGVATAVDKAIHT
jgi:amidase